MTRYQELQWYYQATRQAGHTTFMIEGINFERPAVWLFASNGHAQQAFRQTLDRIQLGNLEEYKPDFARMQIGSVRFATVGWLNRLQENLRGRKWEGMPVVMVDHFAMDMLVREHIEKVLGNKV